MAGIVVQKFGGSSVAGAAKLKTVAARVKARREAGWQLVVVVSAMGDTTDELLGLARQVSVDPPRRELDMLLTCGERISMALLSMALQELGVPAISFTGSQSGIITDGAHAQARILEVRPARIEEALGQGRVVIVAGYQGVSLAREVTTLGRGGSDTTAVALAAALGADCEIYSDVDGVYSADPRVVPDARRLEALSFEEMQALASAGAKVLNAQAVEFAREKGIVIHARSAHAGGAGTRIGPRGQPGRVKGVTCELEVWALTHPGAPGPLLAWLDGQGLQGRSLTFDGRGRTVVLLPLQDVHGLEALRARLPTSVQALEDVATVTCVGAGLNADWTVARTALTLAEAAGVEVLGLSASALQLTLLVPRPAAQALSARLHDALVTSSAPGPQTVG
jgi:aspartate kinase